jgi:hypothetical protein
MLSSLTLAKPAIVQRHNLIDAWIKFLVAFDEVMEGVHQIGGLKYLNVSAFHDVFFYKIEMGSPLYITIRVMDQSGFKTSAHCRMRIYNNEAGKVVTKIRDSKGCVGNIDNVVRGLLVEILDYLKTHVLIVT